MFQIKWIIYLLHGDRFAPSLKNQIRRHWSTRNINSLNVPTLYLVKMGKHIALIPKPTYVARWCSDIFYLPEIRLPGHCDITIATMNLLDPNWSCASVDLWRTLSDRSESPARYAISHRRGSLAPQTITSFRRHCRRLPPRETDHQDHRRHVGYISQRRWQRRPLSALMTEPAVTMRIWSGCVMPAQKLHDALKWRLGWWRR